MSFNMLFAQIAALAFLSLACIAQGVQAEDLIGKYEMGSDITVAESSSYISPYSSTLTLRKDGTYTSGSECFPVNGEYTYVDGIVTLKAGVRGPSRCFYSIVVPPEDVDKYKNPPPPKDKILNVVSWGSGLYLLEDSAWSDFVNAINAGLLPHTERDRNLYLGLFYRRPGGETIITERLPDISSYWKSRILREPVLAKIVAIRKDDNGAYTATVNRGSRAGLREDMVFFRQDADNLLFGRGWVRKVTEDVAEVGFATEVKVGEFVSTRLNRKEK